MLACTQAAQLSGAYAAAVALAQQDEGEGAEVEVEEDVACSPLVSELLPVVWILPQVRRTACVLPNMQACSSPGSLYLT